MLDEPERALLGRFLDVADPNSVDALERLRTGDLTQKRVFRGIGWGVWIGGLDLYVTVEEKSVSEWRTMPGPQPFLTAIMRRFRPPGGLNKTETEALVLAASDSDWERTFLALPRFSLNIVGVGEERIECAGGRTVEVMNYGYRTEAAENLTRLFASFVALPSATRRSLLAATRRGGD